jgi:predicted nucleic acid-binding protein
MGLVISDSSTLIHLASIQRLNLLKTLFQSVTIPSAVWREVVELGGSRAGAIEVTQARQAGWINVVTSTNLILLQLLKRELDDGEAEVIALALERQADLVLIDEADGRYIAETYSLPKTGIIGLLIRAKQEGHISSLKMELDHLLHEGNFWIEDQLYHLALSTVGEQ